MSLDAKGSGHPIDEKLVHRILIDPSEGWREFWQQHQQFIQSVILRYHLPKEDSEDLFQEVSLRLAKKDCELLRAWDPQRCSLKGYLSVITTSVCLNFLRSSFHKYSKRKINNPSTDHLPDFFEQFRDPTPSPRERLERLETLKAFKTCLEGLCEDGKISSTDRLLFEYRLAGMTYNEIADLLDTTLENALQRFHRLKRVVKKRLETAGLNENERGLV